MMITTPVRSGVKLTYDDYVLFPDDGLRHELIDGEHYVTPTPNLRHQEILGHLYSPIATWLEEHPLGRVYFAPLDVILSQYDVVQPDLLFVSNERAPELLKGQWVTGPPDLVVEIGSPSTRKRDRTIKLRLYERWDVLEYWIVDPDKETIDVHTRSSGRFGDPVRLAREKHDVLTTARLPGLEIPLARVFRR